MTLTMEMDVQIMRRSKRHIIRSATGAIEYAANSFAEAIDYLEAIDQREVLLLAGKRRLLIQISPAFAPIEDPRQLKILGVLPEKNGELPST